MNPKHIAEVAEKARKLLQFTKVDSACNRAGGVYFRFSAKGKNCQCWIPDSEIDYINLNDLPAIIAERSRKP